MDVAGGCSCSRRQCGVLQLTGPRSWWGVSLSFPPSLFLMLGRDHLRFERVRARGGMSLEDLSPSHSTVSLCLSLTRKCLHQFGLMVPQIGGGSSFERRAVMARLLVTLHQQRSPEKRPAPSAVVNASVLVMTMTFVDIGPTTTDEG